MRQANVPGFGADMLAARTRLGMSRRDLAKAIGSSYSGLTQVERDERSPSLGLAVRIARELEMSLDKYVSGAG